MLSRLNCPVALVIKTGLTRAQLLLLKAEALDLVEVVAGLLRGDVVCGHSCDSLVAGVVCVVEY